MRDCKDNDKCKDKDIILVCGREVERVRLTNISSNLYNPIVLARLNIDTACLFKPVVTIDFSTMIQVIDSDILATDETEGIELIFELRRNCGGTDETLKEYRFVRDFLLEEGRFNTRHSFVFTYCDDFFCKKTCCVYIVQLVGIRIIGTETIDELIIEDSAINALVQGLCD